MKSQQNRLTHLQGCKIFIVSKYFVVNKGVGLCNEAKAKAKGWVGVDRLFLVSPVANEGLYIGEYTCSTSRLCILQFTHDHF